MLWFAHYDHYVIIGDVKPIWRVSRENWPVRGSKNGKIFGLPNCTKFVLFEVQSYKYLISKYLVTRNSSIFHEITLLFDIPDSIHTLVGYVQPCFEPWTGRFSHNTYHISSGIVLKEHSQGWNWPFWADFEEFWPFLGGLPPHILIHYLSRFVLISEGSEIRGKWADQNNAW